MLYLLALAHKRKEEFPGVPFLNLVLFYVFNLLSSFLLSKTPVQILPICLI